MEMSYSGALVMPSSYAVMNEEEMTYVEGGGTATVRGKAKDIRSRLTTVIGASLTGTGAAAALGALLGNIPGAVIGAVLGNGYFGAYRNCASSAHSQVEAIIKKYGQSKQCVMTTTYSFAFYCTGIKVKVA